MRRVLGDYVREHVKDKVVAQKRQEYAITHLIAFGGADPLTVVNIPWSRLYAVARQTGKVGRPARNSTIRRELGVLTAAVNHARRWARFDGMLTLELPPDTEGEIEQRSREVPYFEKDVLAQIFAAAEANTALCRPNPAAYARALDLEHWMKLAYYTASRSAAVANLTAEQIKISSRTINLHRPGQRVTKKRRPIVPIFDEVLPIVAQRVAAHPSGRIFETNDFYLPFMRLCDAIGIPEPHHPHMLRHSRATHLLQDGKRIYGVAKLLGDTIRTVESIYGHHSPEQLLKELQ